MSTLYLILWIIDMFGKKTVEKYQEYNKNILHKLKKKKKTLLNSTYGRKMCKAAENLFRLYLFN